MIWIYLVAASNFYSELVESYSEGVKLKYYQDKGYGLECTKNIPKGTRVLKLPKELIITAEDFEFYNELSTLDEVAVLAARVAYERTNPSNSFTQKYLHSLPGSFLNYPFWEQSELEFYKAYNFENLDLYSFQDEYKQVKSLLNLTLEEWKWGLGVVVSRGFRYYFREENKVVLIPLLDLANYDSQAFNYSSGYVIDSEGNPVLKAEKNFKSGEAFEWSYGYKDKNTELLENYGFFVDNNPYDYLEVSFERHKVSTNLDKKGPFRTLKRNCYQPTTPVLKLMCQVLLQQRKLFFSQVKRLQTAHLTHLYSAVTS